MKITAKRSGQSVLASPSVAHCAPCLRQERAHTVALRRRCFVVQVLFLAIGIKIKSRQEMLEKVIKQNYISIKPLTVRGKNMHFCNKGYFIYTNINKTI